MFELYDRLIEGIPAGIPVEQICSGSTLTAVCAGGSVGLCETVVDQRRAMTLKPNLSYDLQTLAAFIKSWNYVEASIGMAAINCYYNSAQRLMERGDALAPVRRNPYRSLKRTLENRKVAVIGRTPILEEALEDTVQLSVVTENPVGGTDYPESAVEFILANQDAVFADGRCFVQKKMARLQSNAKRLICHGLGVPLCEMPGVCAVMGFAVLQPEEVMKQVQLGAPMAELLSPALAVVRRGSALQ